MDFVVFERFIYECCRCENMLEFSIDNRDVLECVEVGGCCKKVRFFN